MYLWQSMDASCCCAENPTKQKRIKYKHQLSDREKNKQTKNFAYLHVLPFLYFPFAAQEGNRFRIMTTSSDIKPVIGTSKTQAFTTINVFFAE